MGEEQAPPDAPAPRHAQPRAAAPARKKRETGEEEKGRAESQACAAKAKKKAVQTPRGGRGERPASPPRRRPPAKAPRRARTAASRSAPAKTARLDRVRRTLDESVPSPAEMVQTPPSSLDLDRHASAARTGRLELAEARRNLGSLGDLTRGDVDADAENAYFSGDEAPGGDNPTPDQDIVDDIGKALGVQYQDNEELRASDKVVERDRHRWELDPASSEDYKERK